MIGLGKWVCSVDSMFYRGEVFFTISDNNGEYAFEGSIPDMETPDIDFISVTEDGNTLSAVARTDLLPGKDIEASLTFETDDPFTGLVKIPFIGKIKLKDGKRAT